MAIPHNGQALSEATSSSHLDDKRVDHIRLGAFMIKQSNRSHSVADQSRALAFYTEKLVYGSSPISLDEKSLDRICEFRKRRHVCVFTNRGDERRIGSFMNPCRTHAMISTRRYAELKKAWGA